MGRVTPPLGSLILPLALIPSTEAASQTAVARLAVRATSGHDGGATVGRHTRRVGSTDQLAIFEPVVGYHRPHRFREPPGATKNEASLVRGRA